MFKCFPIPFCNRNLEQIDKRHCNLTSVPDDILRYTRTLEELLLDANQLQDLPKGVYRLTQLRRLTFSDNEIQRILPEIGQLVNLEELDCSRNDIVEIPENIRHCRSLQKFDFSGNPLSNNLPSGIIQLHQLSQLILNDVSLAELPRDIGSLSNLRALEVRENLLKTLPDSLVKLSKLESLDLGSNVIEQLPRNIGHLQSLKELWLDSNELMSLPNDIGQLKRLQCLDVSENKLTYLPDEVGELESLTNLELSTNQIDRLPITIGKLQQHLLILKLNSNSVTKLCDEIGQCSALTELILTENALCEIPKTIGNLKHLTNLNIDRNQLMYLPIEIAECESLGMLSLRDNRLTQVPSELSKLKQLHVLDLSGNRLLNLPCTLLECNLKAIWLAENQAQPMLKFATDIDPSTSENVLTCYLLPQQQHTSSSMDNFLNSSKSHNLNEDVDNLRVTSVHSPYSEQDDLLIDGRHERTGSVKFADQAEAGKESSLQRHNTPHPKDLRSWKNKMAKKFQTDGNLLHHDHQHPFQPNAHMHDDIPRSSIVSGTSVTQPNRINSGSPNMSQESIHYIPPELSSDEHCHNTHNEYDDQTGEEMAYIEKHVEFTEELNNAETVKEPSNQQKLHRRDTPHHLKNKRIINKNSDSFTFDQLMSHSPTKSSIASGGKESVSSSVRNNGRSMVLHQEEIVLTVHRPPNTGLGISIAGGIGSAAYKDNDYGIFLTKVTEDGPAGQAGLLVGDKLLAVNGISLTDCEHNEAVSALKNAGDIIEMILLREVLSSFDDHSINNENSLIKEGEKYSTNIHRDDKQDGQFGFSIAGGNEPVSPTTTAANESLYISKINSQDKVNSLAIGDRVLSINGHDTTNISHDQAVDIINNGGNNVELTLYRESVTNGNPNSSTNSIDNTIEEARIEKGNGPMGLSIVGGIDQACAPFSVEQRGVFISKILPTGSAARTNLRVGDRILKVNNRDISQATHLEAVQALLQPLNEVILLVHHDLQPLGLKEVILTKQSDEPLGIRINGGVDGKHSNPDDPEDDGIFVTDVKDGSPAAGILAVGTRIIEVNNQSLFGAHLEDAQKLLSVPNESIHLVICDGFKPKELISTNSPTYNKSKQSNQNDNASPLIPARSILIQQSASPLLPTKTNGTFNSSSLKNVSISPQVISPTSSQPPPVPVKPKFRPSITESIPINGDGQTSTTKNHSSSSRPQAQNGFEVDVVGVSVNESEKSFNDKKKFFESGLKDSGPKPKPRQFKYINEHELLQMKQEEDQKVKTITPSELLQSRTFNDNDKKDSESMQTKLSNYQTPSYLAKPEEDDDVDDDDDNDDEMFQQPSHNVCSAASRIRYDLMESNETKSDLV